MRRVASDATAADMSWDRFRPGRIVIIVGGLIEKILIIVYHLVGDSF